MTRAEAEAWCAGSVVTVPLFHATTLAAAVEISQRGFDLAHRAGGRAWGNGVYLTAVSDVLNWYLDQIGDRSIAIEVRVDVCRVLSVRIRPTRVLPMYQVLTAIPDGVARFVMASLVERDRSVALTRLLTEGMYDALEILEEPFTPAVGGNQLVIFDPRRIVVISNDSTDRP